MSYLYVIFFVFFNCFVSFVIDAFVARYELEKDGELDQEIREQLESFYASIQDDEYDVIAQVKIKGSEELYKKMYAEEMEELKNDFEKEFDLDESLAKEPKPLREKHHPHDGLSAEARLVNRAKETRLDVRCTASLKARSGSRTGRVCASFDHVTPCAPSSSTTGEGEGDPQDVHLCRLGRHHTELRARWG